MKEVLYHLKKFLKGADLLLLTLCCTAACFGCVLISSATRPMKGGAAPFLRTQVLSIFLGIMIFIIITLIDLDFFARFWKWILAFNIFFILLLIPFGKAGTTGNKSWLYLPGIPFSIQAAEVVKVTFIVLLALHMYYFRDRINDLFPMISFFGHTLFMMGLIMVISADMGVALIYAAILLIMLICAGIKPYWLLISGAAIAAITPFAWTQVLTEKQRTRIIIALNPEMDPLNAGWHALLSKDTLAKGGIFGQGLYKGIQTQSGGFPESQTDFIFAVCGEELGFIGCLAVILLLTIIILRVISTARRAKNGVGALVCFGVAGMMLFQTFENVLMCMGVTPIIGITLPFFSHGGSSNIALFASMGFVSSVRMHPKKGWLDY